MNTPPPDLPEAVLAAALADGWHVHAVTLAYQPVGFGSHHWLVTTADGARYFATVDDLIGKRRSLADTADDAFGRLAAAFGAAHALRYQDFVVAPVTGRGAAVIRRLTERYALVVHPFLAGEPAGAHGSYESSADRDTVVDQLVRLHAAPIPAAAGRDPLVAPKGDVLAMLLAGGESGWAGGPYAEAAGRLLVRHGDEVMALLDHYDRLGRQVAARPRRWVLTHGEPHAGNVMRTPTELLLVDWDTALVAPPERDLWDLAADDPSVLDRYRAAAGVAIDQAALDLYRLWFDLDEIGGYLWLFAQAHERTADTEESWENLRHFLRPRERWPHVFTA